MLRIAKTPDPIQKALREKKSKWNKSVSAFIDDLIHFKKLMNGAPSKFFMQKSRLTEEIPESPADKLDAFLRTFNDIVTEGNSIVEAQLSYIKSRQAAKVKQVTETQPQATPDLTALLSKPASEEYELFSEASNFLTRFLSTLRGPRLGNSPEAVQRRARLSLFNAATDLYKLCSKFQAEISKFNFLSSDLEGLPEANETLIKLENNWLQMRKILQTTMSKLDVKDNINKEKAKELYDIIDSTVKPDITQAATYFTDIDQDQHKEILNQLSIYDKAQDDVVKLNAANKILELYKSILFNLSSSRNSKAKSLTDLAREKIVLDGDLQSKADRTLSKMYGKTMRSLVSRKTNSNRLLAFDAVEDMRTALDQFMNVLENGLDTKALIKILDVDIAKSLHTVVENYDSIIFSMEEGIMTMNPEQRAKFEKLLYNRRQRQLIDRLSPNRNRALTSIEPPKPVVDKK